MKDKWDARGLIERRYQRRLENLAKQISKLFQQAESKSNIVEISRMIAGSKDFLEVTESIARQMVMGVSADNARSWREAARKSRNGQRIYKRLQEELKGEYGSFLAQKIYENSSLIRSMPWEISYEFTKYAQNEAMKGVRSEEIAKSFQEKIPGLSNNQARTIARTEVSKSHTDVIEARCLYLDVPAYIWRSTKGGRTRDSHRKMDGVIILWKDPPSPEVLAGEKGYGKYHAGKIFNCRCYPEPIISLDDISWPARVYSGGQIVRMTKANFIKIAG